METTTPEMTPIQGSESILAAGYNEADKTLYLKFKGGATYAYNGIEKPIYDGFFHKDLKSAGGHFRENLRNHKDFRRLDAK